MARVPHLHQLAEDGRHGHGSLPDDALTLRHQKVPQILDVNIQHPVACLGYGLDDIHSGPGGVAQIRQRAAGASSQRAILDAYFTAFFNAWLDYQDLYTEKRWVVGFTPKLSSRPESVARYFGDYPDGRLISSIRDPHSWFVSLRGKRPDLGPADAISRWIRSTEAILEHRERYGERVRIVSFQSLLEDFRTEGVAVIGASTDSFFSHQTCIADRKTFPPGDYASRHCGHQPRAEPRLGVLKED